MRSMGRHSISVAAVLCAASVVTAAYEQSMLNMKVPSDLNQYELDFVVQHRFYGVIGQGSLEDVLDLMGLGAGARVGMGLRFMVLPWLELESSYVFDDRELTFGTAVTYNAVRYVDLLGAILIAASGDGGRSGTLFAQVAAQGRPMFDRLTPAASLGYDLSSSSLVLSLGLSVEVVEWIRIIAEIHPNVGGSLDENGVIAVGFIVHTAGHQFAFLAGNSSGLGQSNLAPSSRSYDSFSLGFNIQRLTSF